MPEEPNGQNSIPYTGVREIGAPPDPAFNGQVDASGTSGSPGQQPANPPQPYQQFQQFQPPVNNSQLQPKGRSAKPWIIRGVIIAILLLLIGGGIGAYAWYQSPEKIIMDGVLGLVSADDLSYDGEFTLDADKATTAITARGDKTSQALSADVKYTFNSTDGPIGKLSLEAQGKAIVAKDGTIYFKVNDLDKLADSYFETLVNSYSTDEYPGYDKKQLRDMLKKIYQPVIDKFNNQWIKVPASSIGQFNESMSCYQKNIVELQGDLKKTAELALIYQKNKFIVIEEKLAKKDGNVGYRVRIDNAKAKEFGDAIGSSEMGKKLKECSKSSLDGSSGQSEADNSSTKDPEIELWFGEWTHELRKVDISYRDDSNKAKLSLNISKTKSGPAIEIPKDAKSIDELSKGLGTSSPLTP